MDTLNSNSESLFLTPLASSRLCLIQIAVLPGGSFFQPLFCSFHPWFQLFFLIITSMPSPHNHFLGRVIWHSRCVQLGQPLYSLQKEPRLLTRRCNLNTTVTKVTEWDLWNHCSSDKEIMVLETHNTVLHAIQKFQTWKMCIHDFSAWNLSKLISGQVRHVLRPIIG